MRKTVLFMVLAAIGVLGATASAASAPPNTTCETSAKIKISPGLTNTPKEQNVSIKGTLSNCSGEENPAVTGGKYNATLKTAPITCSALTAGAPAEGKLILKLGGNQQGTLMLSVLEGTTPLTGSLEEPGPFGTESISGSVAESYTGGPGCGATVIKKGKEHKAKAVNKGTYSGTLTIS